MIIKIDTRVWVTQKTYCILKKISKQLLNARINDRKVDSWEVKPLGITLVKK